MRHINPVAFSLWLVSAAVAAEPFAVTDKVPPGVQKCAYYLNAAPKTVVPATAAGTCPLDVGPLVPAGTTATLRVAWIVVDLAWGDREGAQSSPLALTPSLPPAAATGLHVVPSIVVP